MAREYLKLYYLACILLTLKAKSAKLFQNARRLTSSVVLGIHQCFSISSVYSCSSLFNAKKLRRLFMATHPSTVTLKSTNIIFNKVHIHTLNSYIVCLFIFEKSKGRSYQKAVLQN